MNRFQKCHDSLQNSEGRDRLPIPPKYKYSKIASLKARS